MAKMLKKKTGRAPKQAPTPEPVETQEDKKPRGRPAEYQESWSKITVTLLDTQIHWLDQLASNIRLNTKSPINRTELIRAFISAAKESGVDLSQVNSEEGVKKSLLKVIL